MMTKQKITMAERLKIGEEARELKLGCTFSPKNTTAFHTIKYDFKPASVDINRVANVDVGSSSQVTVTVPNVANSGVPHTVYKGNHRKYTKECLIIFDKKTGDMTLEKLNHNIQVKKTRSETTNKNSALVPMMKLENSTMRVSSKTKVSTGSRKNHIIDFKPRSSPMQQNSPSGPIHKSPQSAPAWNANNAQATLPSIPMIFDDDSDIASQNGGSTNTCNTTSMQHATGPLHMNKFHVPHQSLSNAKQSKHNDKQVHSLKHNKHQKHQQQPWISQPQQIHQMQQSPSQQQQQQQQQQSTQAANNRCYQKNHLNSINSSSNNTYVKPTNSNNGTSSPNQASFQPLPNVSNILDQEIGVLSSSDSSSDSDSSASDSASDSEDSDENFQQQQNYPPFPELGQGSTSLTTVTSTSSLTTQQPSSAYTKVGFSNDLLHDDLQLSESNTSETSDED